MPFINQPADFLKNDPLGPVSLNRAQANVEAIDELTLFEHFSDGDHNAPEIPWVLGHVNITAPTPTGYLFNTAYGGGTLSRPSTGEATVNVISGVLGTVETYDGTSVPEVSLLGNVCDSDIANKPHLITLQVVSATSIKAWTHRLTSTLGSVGNSWDEPDREFDIAIHGMKQPVDASTLASYTLKQRRDFLTEATTDWNTLVGNQGVVRRNLMAGHTSAGLHNTNRVAKSVGWFKPSAGPSFSITQSSGVSSISYVSTGVVEVTIDRTLSSTNDAACFAQAQPSDDDTEIIVVNGRCTATNKFRFYIYRYSVSEAKWDRADRSFFATMFGSV